MNYEDIQSGYDNVTNIINNLNEYLSVELKKQSVYSLFKDAFDDGVRLYNPEEMELYYIVYIDDLEMVNSKVYNLSKQELRSSVQYITDLPIKKLKPISYDHVCEYIKEHSDKLDENTYCKLQTFFNVNIF